MTNHLKQLNYKIKLLSPVLVSSTVGDENMTLSQDFIAGASLLGVFANMYIKQKNLAMSAHLDPGFSLWFLSDKLWFLNGYITNHDGKRALPIPRSIQFLKTDIDTPIELLFEEPEGQTSYRSGFCILNDDQVERLEVKQQYHFHHQRTNQRIGRSEASEIFNYDSILPGQVFEAQILGQESLLQAFQGWINELTGAKFYARLGRSKHTQYGKVEIDFTSSNIDDPDQFNDFELDPQAGYFTLTLLSDCILLNENGHSAVDVSLLETELRQSLGLAEGELIIERSFVRSQAVENYVAVWKARKPSQNAWCRGSCFKARFDKRLDAGKVQSMTEQLQQLQQIGLGVRRAEGFGRIAINWQQEGVELKLDKTGPQKALKHQFQNQPGPDVPETVQKVFKKLLSTHFESEVRYAALIKLGAFKQMPTGSQVSRLQRLLLAASEDASRSPIASGASLPKLVEAAFQNKIKSLQKTARERLDKIRNQDNTETLLEFLSVSSLTQSNGEIAEIIAGEKLNEAKRLRALVSYSEPELIGLKNHLFELYMNTLFNLMRKAG